MTTRTRFTLHDLTRLALAVLVGAGLSVAVSRSVRADGVIIPEPAPVPTIGIPEPPTDAPLLPPYLTVKYHRVNVDITDQVARTTVDQVFVNDSNRALEGTYIFPLPEDAAISGFAIYVDGARTEGRMLTKDEARRIYERTVSQQRDPALLEYIGRGAFQARVFPIPPHGERRVQIEYTQVLARDTDLVRYVYPLATEKFSPRPLQQVSVTVRIASRRAITAIYSSSHDVAVSRGGDGQATVSYEASNIRPDKDFVLYYGLAQGDIGANVITYRQAGEDGYFLLLVSPRSEVDASKVAAKDVILVLDTSGSMAGEKIIQAKQALRFILDRLNANDRFALIAFSSSVTRFRDGLSPASQREAAHRFVDGLQALGGTNINDALLDALRGLDRERPTTIIFLTDGQPTVGIVNTDKIVANVGAAAPKSVRLFTFGVGYDVNTALLDTLAANQRGVSAYVKPGENLEEPVSAFYAKISRPVLTDVTLDISGVRVGDLYPTPLPDIFAGSQLVLVGRYRTAGAATLTLKGTVNDTRQTYVYDDLGFPAQTGSETAFVARLWATRRIGYLVTQIRLNGAHKELVDEIVSLGLRYGIVTPYTSFLVDERQNVLAAEGQTKASESLGKTLAAPAPTSGAAAVRDSEALRGLREASSAAPTIAGQAAQMRTVADKTFLLRAGVWTDTQYREGMKTLDVGFGSADYFALLAARPEWGKYFALGQKVIVLLDGVAYRVAEGDFPAIGVPAAATPVATATAAARAPAAVDHASPVSRLWRWLLGIVQR